MLVVVISNQPRWVQSKQRHKVARILHANLDLSTNQHMCVCVRERERESVCVSSLFVVFPLIGANIMFSTDFHRIGCIMFSVDFLELGGFRQIDFVQQKGVKEEEEEEEEEGWKGLGEIWNPKDQTYTPQLRSYV
jgi:hypothetical protein